MAFACYIPGHPQNPRHGRYLLIGQVLGLAGTAWLVWISSVRPRLAWQSAASIVSRACFYVLLAWAVSGLMTFLIYLIAADEEPADLLKRSLRSSVAGVWFAPAIILLSTLSPAGLAAAVTLIVATSRMLIRHYVPVRAHQAVRWNPWPAIFAALILQSAVVALLWTYPMVAAVCFALSLATITVLTVLRSGSSQEKPVTMPPAGMGIALTILLASALTTVSLEFSGYAAGRGNGNYDAAKTAAKAPFVAEVIDPEETPVGIGSGGALGVILKLPTKPKAVRLVIPRPNFLKNDPQDPHKVTIPFTGEYWLYEFPFHAPPRSSVVKRGTPLELSFHTNNGHSLFMEAHQKLPEPIPLTCCRALEMNISHTGAAQELFLTLTLIDSRAGRNVELGSAQVGPNASQTLSYKIPPGNDSRKIDEIRIVYRWPGVDMWSSVNLAVDGFVLVPRGR